jgi:hypothetical protein
MNSSSKCILILLIEATDLNRLDLHAWWASTVVVYDIDLE